MSQAQPISKFLPEHEPAVKIQVRVKKSLYDQVNDIRRKEGHSWVELIEAFMEAFVAEKKVPHRVHKEA